MIRRPAPKGTVNNAGTVNPRAKLGMRIGTMLKQKFSRAGQNAKGIGQRMKASPGVIRSNIAARLRKNRKPNRTQSY